MEYHFPIPGGPDEKAIVMFIRRHWASFLGPFFLSFGMFVIPAIILILIYWKFPESMQSNNMSAIIAVVASIYYLVAATVSFVNWLSFYYAVYIICDEEIIDVSQQGFFGRKISRQSILRVQDVSSDISGILPTVFGYGDVLVETAGEQSQNYILKSVPNPQEISAKVMELHNIVVAKEGREQELKSGEGTLKPGPPSQSPPTQNPGSNPPPEENQNSQNIQSSENQIPTYQDLLKKDQLNSLDNLTEVPASPPENNPPTTPSAPSSNQPQENDGEVSQNDLNSGGEIKFE